MARRLREVLRHHKERLHWSRFLVGALYALEKAATLGYRDDPNGAARSKHEGERDTVLAVLCGETGHDEVPGEWQAGFYYNAAIMRLDACSERLRKASARRPDIKGGSLRAVREEVKALKHRESRRPTKVARPGGRGGRDNALLAIDELLSMLE